MSDQSLAKQLFAMTWPMLFGVLSLLSFQLIDSAYIGQLGVTPLAAQGFTMPMQMVIIGIQVGLGIATTAIISRTIGEGRDHVAQQQGGLVLVLGTVGVGLLSAVIYVIRDPILSLLSAPEAVFPVIDQYWIWWLISAWVGAILYFLYSVCRANGNTKLPGILMMVSSVINLALDPLFIFTFDLGINGAAVATILAFGIGILIITPRITKQHWISFNFSGLNIAKQLRTISKIMGPAMISQLLPPVSSMLATKLIASYGSIAIAAWAMGSRYEFFSIVVVLALTMSMPPMVGRLLGQNQLSQIERLVSLAIRFILGFQTLIAVITWLVSAPLSLLLASDGQVQSLVDTQLSIMPISFAPLGVCILLVSISNALGKSYTALTISALRLFAFYLPCMAIGAYFAGLNGIYWGALLGNCGAGIASWLLYRRTLASLRQTHSEQSYA